MESTMIVRTLSMILVRAFGCVAQTCVHTENDTENGYL